MKRHPNETGENDIVPQITWFPTIMPHTKKKTRLLLAATQLAIATTIVGCSAPKESMPPDVAMPDAYRGAATVAAPSDSTIAQMPYQNFFADTALTALIEQTLAHNADLQSALKNIELAEQTLDAAKVVWLPSLNLSAQTIRNESSEHGVRRTPKEFTAAVSASWEVDVWGKIKNRKQSVLANYLKSQEAVKALKTRLVADVASGYYNLLMLDEQLAVARKNLALADKTLAMMQLQYQAGQFTHLAIRQQEAARQQLAATIPQIEQAVAVQENALSVLSGSMPNAITRNPSLLQVKPTNTFAVGIPAAMLHNRPDVQAAEFALKAATADMKESGAAFYPSFTITAQKGVSALQSSDWFNVPSSLFSVVQGTMLQPIFQRGQLEVTYKQSQVKRDQAALAFRQSVVKAVAEVSDALVRIEKLQTQEQLAEERVATLQQAVRNADMLFRSGLATYVEVMSVQSNAHNAELTLADLRRQRLTATAELYRALGGGWR
uniref:RND efflux system, outer membrane lipoprotein, NodT n=1 Tax=Chlorobium chlorochromatii (strain CaD3) TaxID=340177 RepID=Q3ARB5_CHLCH